MKCKDIVFCISVTLLALMIRYLCREFISYDMSTYLIPWFNTIKSGGGLPALKQQVGDYGLLYQTIIAVFTYLNINPVYLYKLLSVFFDFLLALSIAYFVNNSDSGTIFSDHSFALSYGYVLMLPTVFMNSAFYGQSDSIYTFYILWSVWFLYKERFHLSAFMLGLALSFKLQTVLLLPLYLYVCFYKKRFSVYNLFITILTFWLSGIVTYFNGRNIFAGIGIYFFQINEYKHMWMNAPSFWFFIGDDYNKLHLIAIFLTLILIGAGLYVIKDKKMPIDLFQQILCISIFIEWTCIIFLPAMHERYTYVLDLLLVMLAFTDRRYIKYAITALLTSCVAYCALLNSPIIIIYILTWLCFSYTLFREKVF